jgi:flagellar motor switch protein FliN/FliY
MESWCRELGQTLEMMTGSPAQVSQETSPAAAADLWWQNSFSTEPRMTVSVGAAQESWMAAAMTILKAAGIEQAEEDETRSTWLEILEQTASSTARHLSGVAPGPVECSSGKQSPQPPADGHKFQVSISLDGQQFVLMLVIRQEVMSAPEPVAPTLSSSAAGTLPASAPNPAATQTQNSPASRTMEVLLDVHLPVSISFGQAKIPLRDVLKLTTGSVVELNRQPEDAVDIIVNDCVIARGEVVVVDGNYAVRIQSIVGRNQRLTLRPGQLENGGR